MNQVLVFPRRKKGQEKLGGSPRAPLAITADLLSSFYGESLPRVADRLVRAPILAAELLSHLLGTNTNGHTFEVHCRMCMTWCIALTLSLVYFAGHIDHSAEESVS
eukprot:131434-Rhodomonas_salina.1